MRVNCEHTVNTLSTHFQYVLELRLRLQLRCHRCRCRFRCRSVLACFLPCGVALACGSLASLLAARLLMNVMRLTCMETYLNPIYL